MLVSLTGIRRAHWSTWLGDLTKQEPAGLSDCIAKAVRYSAALLGREARGEAPAGDAPCAGRDAPRRRGSRTAAGRAPPAHGTDRVQQVHARCSAQRAAHKAQRPCGWVCRGPLGHRPGPSARRVSVPPGGESVADRPSRMPPRAQDRPTARELRAMAAQSAWGQYAARADQRREGWASAAAARGRLRARGRDFGRCSLGQSRNWSNQDRRSRARKNATCHGAQS